MVREVSLMIVKRIKVKSALSKSGLRELDYSLNPYLGCIHACSYCYAPNFTPDSDASTNWGKVVVVKENLVEVLKREVHMLKRGVVGVSTITDPYQPIEALERLTRRSVELLLQNGFRVSIQTKSPLVLRDIDVLQKYKNKVDVGITVTTLYKDIEPNAPPPKARINALKKLSENGIETWLFLGPIIRGVNDSEVKDIIEEISGISTRVVYDHFNYYKGLKFREGSKEWWEGIKQMINKLCRENGLECHEESEDWIFEKRKQYKPLF